MRIAMLNRCLAVVLEEGEMVADQALRITIFLSGVPA
jgi:hypothetical protein